MRLWLRDSERKPDPAPVQTDDRKAVLVGLILWLAALVALIVLAGPIFAAGAGWLLWTAVVGCGLGILGVIILQAKRR